MSDFRCFDVYTQNNFSSSDYIKKKKRQTLFTNAQTISIGNSNYQQGVEQNAIPPGYLQKENGGETFFNPVYVGTTGEGNRCLIGAHSYDVLYDVLYGAKPNNDKYKDVLTDITKCLSVTSEDWIGNIMQIDFKSLASPDSKIGPAISNIPVGPSNKMNYPARQDFLPKYDEVNPLSEFPGMVIDPCYNVFYPQCPTKFKTNNYNKNVRYNSSILLSNVLNVQQTISLLENKAYQSVNKFPYPLDFSASRCLTTEQLEDIIYHD